MRKVARIVAAAALVAGTPALAQSANGLEHGGGHDNAGAGPPMEVPGGSAGARDIAAQRGEFGRELGHEQSLNRADSARLFHDRSSDYRQDTLHRMEEAKADLAAVRGGGKLGLSSEEARKQFEKDMREWREAFGIDRKAWMEMRDAWLADKDSLTAEQWAERRAAWFDQRDAWIAQQEEWAKSHAG